MNVTIKIGALAPLSRPGWVQAGRQLLAGLELAAQDINRSGGVAGKPLELLVRDTAADPARSAEAIEELARIGVAAVAGEYHSVAAAAAAARAETLGLPFLCSSAVLDGLTMRPASWVARLAPPQSRGWSLFADFLLASGHRNIAVISQPSIYWAAGTQILRQSLARDGGAVAEVDISGVAVSALSERIAESRATVVLLLVGYPEPAAAIVKSLREEPCLAGTFLGAPAGQPEFDDWLQVLGHHGAAIPFLRYLPRPLTSMGLRVTGLLRERLARIPSFVALEGYDTLLAVAAFLRKQHASDAAGPNAWSRISVEGTRGKIWFEQGPSDSVWQWPGAPMQVVDRDPSDINRFRVLYPPI